MTVPAMAASRPDIQLGRSADSLRCRCGSAKSSSVEWGCFRWRGAGWDTKSLQSERALALCCHLGCWCVPTSGVRTPCGFRATASRSVAIRTLGAVGSLGCTRCWCGVAQMPKIKGKYNSRGRKDHTHKKYLKYKKGIIFRPYVTCYPARAAAGCDRGHTRSPISGDWRDLAIQRPGEADARKRAASLHRQNRPSGRP